jgi:DNA-binding GntR family transcriptional regulator
MARRPKLNAPTAEPTVSRKNSLALHEQIRRAILTDIWKGLHRPGDLLPSEKELSLRFGVNRLTVRQAVHALANQGHVRPLQGRGYQVRTASLAPDILTVISTSHYLEEHGIDASSKSLGTEIVPADPEIADALGIRRGADVIKFVRQRFALDALISLDEVYYDAEKFVGLADVDLTHVSLTDSLFKIYDLRVGRITTTLGACLARERAELLDVPPGSPLLLASTVNFDLEDRPVEFGLTFWRADRMSFSFTSPIDPSQWPYGSEAR